MATCGLERIFAVACAPSTEAVRRHGTPYHHLVVSEYIVHASWRYCGSAQPCQLIACPAAHRAQDLQAHALAQAQLLEVGVVA